MSWACDFPEDLKVRPLGLVVLAGLDATYNAVHKAVWDLFCNNRKSDRVPLNFVTFPVDHEYPKAKPKRQSYEWYSPKGILRRDWMSKHLARVPSLIITFFDLDWDDPHWNERLIECASRLSVIRNSIEKRSTKLAAVLIQRSPPLPPGEDNLAAERATAFCTECELSPKSLFVLPQTDHLFGYIIRLENAFLELSQNYYTTNIRRVKAHRDYLNRTTHQVLFIRHQFKVAFFHELKQDTQMALKHYKQAYGYCLEAKVNDHTILEIKAIAGFISYKICSLSFFHNTPLDAIEQFRKHIEHFKVRVGPPYLAFEHSSWLSKQFQLFGEIFDNAIRIGLTAIQTQHPGFYYQQAAMHSITRKQLCIGLCRAQSGSPPQVLHTYMEFFGHRPWSSAQGSEASQMSNEEAVQALQSFELTTNHSEEIIQLLTIAINHFQKHKCTRMRYHLLVMIGEEHYHAKEYSKALQILTRVAQEYRQERWYSLLTTVITTALRSAYLLASIQDYLNLALEYLAEEICRSAETKTRVQVDLLQIICGQVPDPQPGCDVQAVDLANQKWQSVVAGKEGSIELMVVDMNKILSFVDCKVCFMKPKYKVDEDVVVSVYIRCKSQFSLRFSELELVFNDEKYNGTCIIKDDGDLMAVIEEDQLNSKDLLFLSNEIKLFRFTLNPTVQDMGKSLLVTNVHLKFKATIPVTLNFTMQSTVLVEDEVDRSQQTLDPENETIPAWTAILHRNCADLACRSSELIITPECDKSCLLNESFSITWRLVNNESSDITNVRCSFQVGEANSFSVISMVQADVIQSRGGADHFALEQMVQKDQVERIIYLRCSEVGNVKLTAKVLYNIGEDQFYQSTDLNLEVIEPFKVSSRYTSTKLEDRLSVNADEPFLLQFTVSNITEYPLYIQKVELCLSDHVPESNNEPVPQISNVILHTQEEATEYQCLVIPDSANNDIIPGEYKIMWRRENGDVDSLVEMIISLPALQVEHQPLYVECDIPAYGRVHKPMEIGYTLYNRTGYVQEFEASMDSCDSFAFSGHKQLNFRTLPYASHSINFTLYPLSSGKVPLPPFRLSMMKHTNMTDVVNKLIPQDIFVMIWFSAINPNSAARLYKALYPNSIANGVQSELVLSMSNFRDYHKNNL